MRGWENFEAARGVEKGLQIAVFMSASEGFSQNNVNCSVAESIEHLAPVVSEAVAAGVSVRGYVSCVVECPFDGPTSPEQVALCVSQLQALGPMEVSLGDTLGRALPDQVAPMLDAVLSEAPADQLAGHFHDTAGRALPNIEVALEKGLRVFDSAVGGLGGCPYAPGAPGNVATEDVLGLMDRLGFETGIDADAIAKAASFAKELKC